MIKKIEIDGVHMEVGEDLRKYVFKKIGKLDRYIPRRARESAHLEVKLKGAKAKDKKQYTCEVILHLPNETIMTQETTINIFAAVDIVETKLKNQIKKYKDKYANRDITRRLLAKLRSRNPA